jgi:hypothetical protein
MLGKGRKTLNFRKNRARGKPTIDLQYGPDLYVFLPQRLTPDCESIRSLPRTRFFVKIEQYPHTPELGLQRPH